LPDAPTTLTGVAVEYTASIASVAPERVRGFFEGWPVAPAPVRHLEILRGSYGVALAREPGSPQLIGFANAISDGVLTAFTPLLEVLPGHRGRGIGSAIIRRLLGELDHLYSIDVMCDVELEPFYTKLGLQPLLGMALRRPERCEIR
jgi:GNAT superfamily N-acetyltransferase